MESSRKTLDAALGAFDNGRYEEAAALCRTLAQAVPEDGQALFLLGMSLYKAGLHDESIIWLSRAAAVQPGSARVFSGLGCAYEAAGDYRRADECLAQAIKLNPLDADAHYNMGNVCHRMRQPEKAVSSYRQAVELNPADYESWHNLGKTLKDLNRIDESVAAYDRALELRSDLVLTHCNRALALLRAGRLEEGFREYEWRWRATLSLRGYPQPLWEGEALPDQTLLVLAEQGFGDEIQFVRFVRQARERMGRVVLECRAQLKTLFEHSGCADAVVTYGDAPPSFDCYGSIMSLPRIFQTGLATIPGTPYLAAPSCEDLPLASSATFKVGLVWAGNPRHHDDAARSMRLKDLDPILRTPGVVFYSVQMPVPSRDEAEVRSHPNIVDLSGRIKDFLDTAAVVGAMDLVIAVDTAVAHLAGALGKPVWTCVQYSPDWRWLLDRPDTPWYPTMRLFRQPRRGEWRPVARQMAKELRRLVSGQPRM